jgi:hypothetical protein
MVSGQMGIWQSGIWQSGIFVPYQIYRIVKKGKIGTYFS